MKKTEKILGIVVLSLMLFGFGVYVSQGKETVDSFANSNREEESTNTDEDKADAENYNTEEKSNTDEGIGVEAFVMEVIEIGEGGVNATFVDFPESDKMMFITHQDLELALEVGDIIEMIIEEGKFDNVLKVSLYEGEGLEDRVNKAMEEMFENGMVKVEKF